MMDKSAKIYLAGHRGLVGSALLRRLEADGYSNIVTRTHSELDLIDQAAVKTFFETEQPSVCAAGRSKSRRDSSELDLSC